MTRYIYPAHLSRDGRLVIPIRAIGHIGKSDSDNAVWCGEQMETARRKSWPIPGRKLCRVCLGAAGLRPPVKPSTKEQRRQAELVAWERLTGERPGR